MNNNYGNLKLVRYRKKLYWLDVSKTEIDILRGTEPSHDVIKNICKNDGLWELTRLSDNKIRYVYKNEKLEDVKIDKKLHNKICKKYDWWEEEFKGVMFNLGNYDGGVDFINNGNFGKITKEHVYWGNIVEKYLGVKEESYPQDKGYKSPKVKIKCKNGSILIERIE